jgi:beta-glucanase (GH16 family)
MTAVVKRRLLTVCVLTGCLAAAAGVLHVGDSRGDELLGQRARPAAPAAKPPRPIAGLGYRQVFVDNFGRFDRGRWSNHAFWEAAPHANAVYARKGVLQLVSRRSQGYRNVTISSHGKRSFRHGYFEARMRWTKGPGAWPAFWLSSAYHYKNARCPYFNSELDIFEGQGSTPATFYGTLHRNTNHVCGVPDQTRPAVAWHRVGDMTTRFHVYSALWTANEVVWYFDRRRVGRAPVFAGSTDQRMYMLIYMWIGGWTSGPTPATPDELRTEVDWVRVWQK